MQSGIIQRDHKIYFTTLQDYNMNNTLDEIHSRRQWRSRGEWGSVPPEKGKVVRMFFGVKN